MRHTICVQIRRIICGQMSHTTMTTCGQMSHTTCVQMRHIICDQMRHTKYGQTHVFKRDTQHAIK